LRSPRPGYLILVLDMIMLLAFVAAAVIGAEVVRLTCRRQLTVVPVHRASVAAEAATVGVADVD
jgi:hypothetical protein